MSILRRFDLGLWLLLLEFIQSFPLKAYSARVSTRTKSLQIRGLERRDTLIGKVSTNDLGRAFVDVDDDFQNVYHARRLHVASASFDGQPVSETASLPDIWFPYISKRKKRGEGAFGDVAEFTLSCPKQTPIQAALKVIPQDLHDPEKEKLLNNEISSLTEVSSFLNDPEKAKAFPEDMRPYVLSLLAKPEAAAGHLFIVSPFFNSGDVEKAIGKKAWFGGQKAMYGFMLHIAKGVRLMHEVGWVHGDIKGENALLSCNGNSKTVGNCVATVIDFGLSCRIDEATCKRVGTSYYVAPEVLVRTKTGGKPDPKTDVWSLGILLWEIRFGFGNLPTYAQTTAGILQKVVNLDRSTLDFSGACALPPEEESLKELLKGMLTRSLDFRLTMDQVIEQLSALAPEVMRTASASQVPEDAAECLKRDYKSATSIEGEGIPVNESHSFGDNPASAPAQKGESFQCCYVPPTMMGWLSKGINRKGSHHITLEGASCAWSSMRAYADYESCNTLGGGSCEKCWSTCCEKMRHPGNIDEMCKGAKAVVKREKECYFSYAKKWL